MQHTVSLWKPNHHQLITVTSSYHNRCSQFFHRWKDYWISNKRKRTLTFPVACTWSKLWTKLLPWVNDQVLGHSVNLGHTSRFFILDFTKLLQFWEVVEFVFASWNEAARRTVLSFATVLFATSRYLMSALVKRPPPPPTHQSVSVVGSSAEHENLDLLLIPPLHFTWHITYDFDMMT